jgi:hypothetical protein
VYAGTDSLTGRRIYLRESAKTSQQAKAVLSRLLARAAIGRQPESDATVGYLLGQYMENAELDVSTRDGYEGYIRRTISPALGAKPLRKVRGPVLDTFYARLRRCGDLTCAGRPFTEHRNVPVLTVSPGDGRPAWQQVADVVRVAVSSGQLAPGEALPSVREMAALQGLRTATLQYALGPADFPP